MTKIVVVGANHAGTAAINTICTNYPDCEVTVFERGHLTSFLGCGTALWLGNQIVGTDKDLFYSSPDALRQAGAVVNTDTEVTKIDYNNKTVYFSNANGMGAEKYDKLILACGSTPIHPNIPGMDLENVQFIKLYDEAKKIADKIDNPEFKHITVVGAGYIGVEVAEAFVRRGKKVTLLDALPHTLSAYYDPQFCEWMDENLVSNGVDLRLNTMVKELKGDGRVREVITDKGSFETDMVIMCIGFRANSKLAEGKLTLSKKGGAILVDKKQRTSFKDVYAIGDCATVYDNAIQDVNYIALATNAVRAGIVAAHNACGTEIESLGVQGSNGIHIWNLKMISTGITETKAKALGMNVSANYYQDFQLPGFMANNQEVGLKIVYETETRRIVGMQCAAHIDISMLNHLFSLAIQEKVTVDKLALLDIFFLPHFNQPYNYITMAALTAK